MNTLRIGLVIPVLALLLSWPAGASAEVVERIAAVVNEDAILMSRLKQRATPLIEMAIQQQSQMGGGDMPPVERQRLMRRVLVEMIDEVLIAEQASKMRVRITSTEVDRAMKNMARQNRLNWSDFVRAIQAQGYDLSRYREELRRQLLRFKVVQTKFQGRLRVSDREIDTYYIKQVRQARSGDRCRMAYILVKVEPEAGAATIAQRRRRAKAILAKAEEGAPFGALARRYSEDLGSAKNGGSLGWVDSSELSDELRDTVLSLGAGKLGGPVRTEDGFRVIKVLEWEASDVRPLEQVRENIRLHLLEEQMEQQERLWLADLRRKAYIDVRMWR
jgi:peptidyl-prolyl cis-trans isomerase SurA